MTVNFSCIGVRHLKELLKLHSFSRQSSAMARFIIQCVTFPPKLIQLGADLRWISLHSRGSRRLALQTLQRGYPIHFLSLVNKKFGIT